MSHSHLPNRDAEGRFANYREDLERSVIRSLCWVLLVALLGAVVYQLVKPEPLSPVSYFPFHISPISEFPMRVMASEKPLNTTAVDVSSVTGRLTSEDSTAPTPTVGVTPPVQDSGGFGQVLAESPTVTPWTIKGDVPIEEVLKEPKGVVEKIIHQTFGEYAYKGIKMLSTCENSKLDPHIINKANRNGTWDVGVWQINVDPTNTEEVERLKDPVYNTQRAWQKFTSKENTFYHWTCGYVVGDYTYVDYLKSLK